MTSTVPFSVASFEFVVAVASAGQNIGLYVWSVESVSVSKHVVPDVPVTDDVDSVHVGRRCTVEDESSHVRTDEASYAEKRDRQNGGSRECLRKLVSGGHKDPKTPRDPYMGIVTNRPCFVTLTGTVRIWVNISECGGKHDELYNIMHMFGLFIGWNTATLL